MEKERFNKSQAARFIGIARRTFYDWLLEVQKTDQAFFTRAELTALARQHGREPAPLEIVKLRAEVAALRADLDALAERVRELERQQETEP